MPAGRQPEHVAKRMESQVSLEETTLALFAVCNSLRVFAYLPQIHKAAACRNGASSVSCATWGFFLLAHLSTVAYALVNRSDWQMAALFAGNAVCCLIIIAIAWWKRRRRARSMPHRLVESGIAVQPAGQVSPTLPEKQISRTTSRQSLLARRSGGRGLRTALIAAALLAVLSPPAYPHVHSHSDGTEVTWYPVECCNNRDCRPVAHVRHAKDGLWMTTVDGVTVLVHADEQRRPSRDTRWHVCLATDASRNVVVQCLFEPPPTS